MGGGAQGTPAAGQPPGDQELAKAQADCRLWLAAAAKSTGRHPDELLAETSRAPNEKVIGSIDNCDRPAWLRTTADRLRQIHTRAQANGPATEGTDETKAFWDRHPNAVADCVSYIEEHGNLEPPVAADLWLQDAGAPFHARIDVRRAALLRVKPP